MHKSAVPGAARVGRPHAESLTPCLVFEAVRDEQGQLFTFRCVAWNAAAEACGRALEPGGGLARWVEEVEGQLEAPACVRVVETGEPYTTELCSRRAGAEVWWQATAVRQDEGFALWLREVTEARLEERRAREALERSRAREERMEEEAEFRERFIGILGHDLRSPLNAISLSARAMAHYGPLTPMQRELGLRIESSAARMAKMISDILDLTRARRSDGIPLVLAPVRVEEVCRQVVEELSAAHPERSIRYEAEGEGEGVWDGERLAQLLTNLVSNALEHGGEQVPVVVRSYALGELQALEVYNPGPPIAPQQLATLFEPFQSGPHRGQGRRRTGLGLGLFIVKQIALSHGGRVVVHSAEGEGTTFSVLLPRDARAEQAEALPAQEPLGAEAPLARLPGA